MIDMNYKNECMCALANYLSPLRAKAGITQDSLANMIGISRQTYYAIENRKRNMSWSTFIALIFYFDANERTKEMLHSLGLFPNGLVEQIKANCDQ